MNQGDPISVTDFDLERRQGDPPAVNPGMPHLQLNQNADEATYQRLADWLFSQEHVEERRSRVSIPSSRAAWIVESETINPVAEREFTHIHTEPGPGSQHMPVPDDVAAEILGKGWGEPHPMNPHIPKYELVMVYAPRDDEELDTIKAIITRAYAWALDSTP